MRQPVLQNTFGKERAPMKQWFSILLTVCMLLSLFSGVLCVTAAGAYDAVKLNGFTFILNQTVGEFVRKHILAPTLYAPMLPAIGAASHTSFGKREKLPVLSKNGIPCTSIGFSLQSIIFISLPSF